MKLIFLKRCNQANVVPSFIKNSVRIKNQKHYFPLTVRIIRAIIPPALKQNIKKTYLEIAAIKSKLVCVKNQPKQSVSTELHNKSMSIFDDNNKCIKFPEKRRLIEKILVVNERTYNDACG